MSVSNASRQRRRPASRRPSRGEPPPQRRSEAAFASATAVAVAVLAVLVFLPLGHAGYAPLDDNVYVTSNPQVRAGLTAAGVQWAFVTGAAANWHPLTWLSLMLDVQLFGVSAGPQHVVNLILHALNAALWLLALWRLTGALWRSAVVAALFAVHPLHVESVAWIAERKDLLSTAFWALTLIAYSAYVRRPTGGRMAAVTAWLAAGLMAKPMLVTVPLVLLLLDVWPLGRLGAPAGAAAPTLPARWRPLVVEKIPLFILAAASSIVTVIAQRQGGALRTLELIPFALRAQNAVVAYAVYLAKTVWPVNLIFYYAHPAGFPAGQVAGAIALLAAGTVAALVLARRLPYVAVGWLWYLGTLFPVIGLVQVGSQAMADRYTYVPLIGVFIAAVWGTADLLRKTRISPVVGPALTACALSACAAISVGQTRHWQSASSLWTHAIAVTLDVDDARASRAVTALTDARGETRPEIVGFFQLPAARAHDFLGVVLDQARDLPGAAVSYREAARLDPGFPEAHAHLGRALGREGRLDEAVVELTTAARLSPGDATIHRDLGLALAALGRRAEAIQELRAALRLAPGDEAARRGLAAIGG